MTYVQLQQLHFKYFRCYDPRKYILSSDTKYEMVGKIPRYSLCIMTSQCKMTSFCTCRPQCKMMSLCAVKKTDLRWADLFCNYYHIQCAHNHSAELVVVF
jgi:hypothetical protein